MEVNVVNTKKNAEHDLFVKSKNFAELICRTYNVRLPNLNYPVVAANEVLSESENEDDDDDYDYEEDVDSPIQEDHSQLGQLKAGDVDEVPSGDVGPAGTEGTSHGEGVHQNDP
ncbi:hypothetical protein MKX03_006646 [Papaver bracteatum]|nr:hypothetical protein MKX03_006646 [Papaver bracteatum]